MKYKIKKYTNKPYYPCQIEINTYKQWAREMKQKYGLTKWTIKEIVQIWENYSDSMCANWLIDDKFNVEEAFGVELEEISNNEGNKIKK